MIKTGCLCGARRCEVILCMPGIGRKQFAVVPLVAVGEPETCPGIGPLLNVYVRASPLTTLRNSQ